MLRLHGGRSGLLFARLLLIHSKAHVAGRAVSDDLGAEAAVEVAGNVASVFEKTVAISGLRFSVAPAAAVHAALDALRVQRNVLKVLRSGHRIFHDNAVHGRVASSGFCPEGVGANGTTGKVGSVPRRTH